MELRRSLLRDELEIKTFILFVLKHFYEPIQLEVLNEISLDRVSNYFDFMDALHDLEINQMIQLSESDRSCMITVKGRYMLQAVENVLRPSTKRHIVEEIERIIAENRRDSAISTTIHQEEDVYVVDLTLNADHGPILKLGLRASDRSSAEKMVEGFRARAEKVYLGIIDTLIKPDENN